MTNLIVSELNKTLSITADNKVNTYTKTYIIGTKSFFIFESEKDKSRIEVPCTEDEYDKLILRNSEKPNRDGYVYVGAYKNWKFDTPSGDLENGYYAEYNDKFLTSEHTLKTPWYPKSIK